MDYKYIEQLLERYWQCETTLQEEAILRSFFAQEEVPVWLLKYKTVFDAITQEEQTLGEDFDHRILAMTEQQKTVKARTISLTQRLMPLFKAAAIVAIILTLGNAAQAPWEWGYDNPREAMEAMKADSIAMDEPVQAENLADTTQTLSMPLPKY
jgi:hypothetical protein